MDTVRAERGTKRTCVACDERFYDLNRNPITCPVCGNVHGPEAFVKQRELVEAVPLAPAAAATGSTGSIHCRVAGKRQPPWRREWIPSPK